MREDFMRRIATVLSLAIVVAAIGCSADAPGPTTQPPGGGGGSSGGLQVRLFVADPNPNAGTCTLVEAVVTRDGNNVPDGTGVFLSTSLGFFSQNLTNTISVVTQGGSAQTAVCSDESGIAIVRAEANLSGLRATTTTSVSFQPSGAAAPFVSFCNPTIGSPNGGDVLTLTGGRFFGSAGTTRVTFTAAGVTREAIVQSVTDSTITVLTPAFPEAQSPAVPVLITITLGANLPNPVTLTAPNCFVFGNTGQFDPRVTAVLPSSGPNEGGTRVTIIGSGFQAPVQVFFGQVEATVVSVAYSQVVALSPAAFGAGQQNLNAQVDVRVRNTTSGLEGVLPGGFRFTTKVLLTSISNAIQRVDAPFTPVTIFGQGFSAPVAVTLAGIPAFVMSTSATELVVLPSLPVIASCADVSGDVRVVNIESGDFDEGLNFQYLVSQTRPVIATISPTSGPGAGGTAVLITGTNLPLTIPDTRVTFGVIDAVVTGVTGGTSVSATSPPTTAGPPACGSSPVGTPLVAQTVTVTVTNRRTGCSGSFSSFQYLLPCVVASGAPVLAP
jgi:hypothetical protein